MIEKDLYKNKKYKFILFDLDGTLTDSREGIFNCIRYALEKMGEPVPDEDILRGFIGPPLADSFIKYCDFDNIRARQAVTLFRERYAPIGKFENAAAPGMPELCEKLYQNGYILALASSKPESMCRPICEKFGFAPFLREITGSPPYDDWNKIQVIQEAMRRLKLNLEDKSQTVMIGDRKYDVEGARECGLDCIGTDFFHYGPPGELEQAGAIAIARDAKELEKILLPPDLN